jgi:hypothetical protein
MGLVITIPNNFPLVPTLSQITLVHMIPSYLFTTHFIITLPPTHKPSKWPSLFRCFNQNPMCIYPLLHTCHMSHPSHPLSLEHPNNNEECLEKITNPHSVGFPRPTLTFSLLSPNILLSTMFTNAICLRSPLNMIDQDSQPYKNWHNFSDVCF